MKILELIPTLGTGGAEKFVIDLSNDFVRKGCNCSIVTLYNPTEDEPLRQYIDGAINMDSLGKCPGADLNCMFRVARYVSRMAPDVVHVHSAAIMYILIAAICMRNIKYFATLHSEAKREAGKGLPRWIRLILFKLGLVTPITISEESEKSFEKFYGYSTNMIHNGCVPYVINHETNSHLRMYRNNVDYLFIHVGRIHGVKNQLMLVESFKRIVEKGVNARLLIAGRAEDKNIFEQLKSYFTERIVYIGEQTDIRALMSVSDAFCLSSTMEGMPITIIEAMSVGCIPIVTPVGGCKDMIIDGKNGFISTDVSEIAYQEALLRFLSTPHEAIKDIKNNCIQDYEKKYSINHTSSEYINLFSVVK